VRWLKSRFATSGSSFRAVFGNPNLRWLELAWMASIFGHYAYLIAVSIYAYDVGGEAAVGLVFLARLIPAALAAPFAGMLGDRFRRERVLLVTNLTRCSLVTAAAVGVLVDAEPLLVYALAIAATIANTPFRSAQAALTPTLARSPSELTAANAVTSGIDSLALFGGPALAGLLVAVTSTGAVFLITAALILLSALLVLLIRTEDSAERPRRELESATIVSEALAGFRTLAGHPSLRVMVGLITAQTTVAGAVQVFIVVASVELLGFGSAGVGYLNAAIGVGAFIGALAALSLTGVRRLSPAFLVGLSFWGYPLIALGLWQSAPASIFLFGVIGVGNAISSVAGNTLIQRSVPDEVLARVFGVIQMLALASMGIGAAFAPVLISVLGIEGALIATGAVLPVLVLVAWPRVSRIDAAAEPPKPDELRVLTSIPIFSPLPGASLESLATRLVPLRLEPGTIIVKEGDAGDRFYILVEGDVAVSFEGAALPDLHAGGYFGEIALLRDIPRTATVTAKTNVVLYALDRDDFLATVTGHAPSAEAAEEVVSARLATVPAQGSAPLG
jgi:MFS family permease